MGQSRSLTLALIKGWETNNAGLHLFNFEPRTPGQDAMPKVRCSPRLTLIMHVSIQVIGKSQAAEITISVENRSKVVSFMTS